MNEQEQFWQEFADLKIHVCYIDHYQMRNGRIDIGLEMFLAVAATTSIGTWAVFQTCPLVWGGIIAGSQVIHAIKPFLPYKKRLKAPAGLSFDLGKLLLSVDDDWYKISSGQLTNSEIHSIRMKVKRDSSLLVHKHFGTESLPKNAGYLKKGGYGCPSLFCQLLRFVRNHDRQPSETRAAPSVPRSRERACAAADRRAYPDAAGSGSPPRADAADCTPKHHFPDIALGSVSLTDHLAASRE